MDGVWFVMWVLCTGDGCMYISKKISRAEKEDAFGVERIARVE